MKKLEHCVGVKMMTDNTAYAKLHGKMEGGQELEKFLTNFPVKLGRAPDDGGKTSIQIGDNKSISREHACVDWNSEKGHFEVKCVGKNGITVDQMLYKPENVPAPLRQNSAVKIGGTRFYFLLPKKRPNFTVLQLCTKAAKAIVESNGKNILSVRGLTEWVADNFDYYRNKDQKSAFEKTARSAMSSKKGREIFDKEEVPKKSGKGKLVHWKYIGPGGDNRKRKGADVSESETKKKPKTVPGSDTDGTGGSGESDDGSDGSDGSDGTDETGGTGEDE